MELLADTSDDILIKKMDQFVFFKGRNKNTGRYQTFLWISPPGQRFEAAETAGKGADDRLVSDLDPVLADCLFDVLDDIFFANHSFT